MTVLVTGAHGFVGSALCADARMRQAGVRAAVRQRRSDGEIEVGDIGPGTDWREALAGCDLVLHTAARVHVMHDTAADPLQAFRQVNVGGSVSLARQAAAAGVRRLVFLSSVKVNGEQTVPGRPFRAGDVPAPADPYGISKLEAELALRAIASETGLEVVIVRPPLVYGPGVKANFLAMMRCLQRGLPLPLASVTDNRRSLIGLDNLVDLVATCAFHPDAAGHVFMASDGEDLSTAGLLRRMARAMGKPARLVPVSPALLQAAARLAGKGAAAARLLGSLQVDISDTRQVLGWTPPVSVDEGLRRAAAGMAR